MYKALKILKYTYYFKQKLKYFVWASLILKCLAKKKKKNGKQSHHHTGGGFVNMNMALDLGQEAPGFIALCAAVRPYNENELMI